jgi:hypothetical protein
MLEYKSLLSVSGASKYYRLQSLKANNWKNIEVVRQGENGLSATFLLSAGRSLRFIRALHVEDCRASHPSVISVFSVSMIYLRHIKFIGVNGVDKNFMEQLIRVKLCCH